MRTDTPVFNTDRMVKEYTERLYTPAAKGHQEFGRDGCAAATGLSQWKAKMRKAWPQVTILDVQVGESLQIAARIHLGAVHPDHVRVEAYYGEADNGGIKNPSVTVLDGSTPSEGEG